MDAPASRQSASGQSSLRKFRQTMREFASGQDPGVRRAAQERVQRHAASMRDIVTQAPPAPPAAPAAPAAPATPVPSSAPAPAPVPSSAPVPAPASLPVSAPVSASVPATTETKRWSTVQLVILGVVVLAVAAAGCYAAYRLAGGSSGHQDETDISADDVQSSEPETDRQNRPAVISVTDAMARGDRVPPLHPRPTQLASGATIPLGAPPPSGMPVGPDGSRGLPAFSRGIQQSYVQGNLTTQGTVPYMYPTQRTFDAAEDAHSMIDDMGAIIIPA